MRTQSRSTILSQPVYCEFPFISAYCELHLTGTNCELSFTGLYTISMRENMFVAGDSQACLKWPRMCCTLAQSSPLGLATQSTETFSVLETKVRSLVKDIHTDISFYHMIPTQTPALLPSKAGTCRSLLDRNMISARIDRHAGNSPLRG